LVVDTEAYGAFKLSATARAVLKGETQVALREQAPGTQPKRRRTKSGATAQNTRPADTGSAGLLAKLRAWRLATAQQHGVPAFVIFHDSTLAEIAHRIPRSFDELGEIPGIGAKKLERYGSELLELAR